MTKYVIIGAGISGLSIAQMLNADNEVVVLESDSRPGGLIKCDIVDGSLYHRTGGHVFNTKRKDVLEWFWKFFDKENEFIKSLRNASVELSGNMIPYPIENNVYLLDESIQKAFICDLLEIAKLGNYMPVNFEDFLLKRFGPTLYELYFKPYNLKIWRKDLSNIPLSWLEGKLPMPSVVDMIYNNFNHIKETNFVHSSFYYPKKGGSQFLVDRFAQGLDIRYNTRVSEVKRENGKWNVNGIIADKVVYCGNVKYIKNLLNESVDISVFSQELEQLKYHGTTTVFCEIEENPYSWVYLPSNLHDSHRIICTGNFAQSNNAKKNCNTATIEFTDYISLDDIKANLKLVPFSPQYLTHHFEKYTYPIQSENTRSMIKSLKKVLQANDFYLLGRFAEWEYFNMDAAIGSAIDLHKDSFLVG